MMIIRIIAIPVVPQTFQKYASVLVVLTIPSRFMPKYEVKKESGRNVIVTAVKMKTALL